VSTRLYDGAEARARELGRLRRKLDAVSRELDHLGADPAADPDYLRTKRSERERLDGERRRLESAPIGAPAGSYAIAALVPVKRRIARDDKLVAAMRELDARIGESNRAAAEKVPAPAAAPGEARFVGVEECELCHAAAVKLWKGTVHAHAWEILVDANKQWSYDCIGCHVTGYGRAGGSAMAHVDGLTAVQCENCHGPGSLHADRPKQVHLELPTERTCKECHTREHSDTFDYQPYLRDVLGPGHGEKRRAALGAGVTGHELRHGALERARMD
jgi:hypothetical protein